MVMVDDAGLRWAAAAEVVDLLAAAGIGVGLITPSQPLPIRPAHPRDVGAADVERLLRIAGWGVGGETERKTDDGTRANQGGTEPGTDTLFVGACWQGNW